MSSEQDFKIKVKSSLPDDSWGEQKKEKSTFQKLTLFVVILMLVLTIFGVIAGAVITLL